MLPSTCLSCSCIWSYFRPFPQRFRCDWPTSQARYVRVHFTRRALHASCESPWHSLAKRHLLGACFPRMAPFRSMLLTLRGGPESFAPRAHQIPVYLLVFSTFLCRAFTAHRAVMIGDPLAILAIDAPDSHRGAHHVLGYVACHTVRLRGDGALLQVGHQPVRVLPETGVHQLVDGLCLERLAQHGQQMPLPLAPEQRVGQILEMLPARARGIIAPTGGEHMQMRVRLPIAAMRVEYGDIPACEGFPFHGAIEIIKALGPTADTRAQQDRGMLVERRAEHRRHRQDDVPIDDPLVQHFTHLTDPVIRIDLGTP